jgi:glycosyltransferase involved in cell wall biosynthesis
VTSPPARGYVLYTPVLRSAHLERLGPRPGFRVLASGRHPDCDDALLAAAPFPVLLAEPDELAEALKADPPEVLEVTEPLWTAQWPAALRLADAAPAARLVTYAIEVLPPPAAPAAGRLRAVAFGSHRAAMAYAACYPGATWDTTVVEERRDRCPVCFGGQPDGARVPAARELVFAAEFSERKAVDLLMAAWDAAGPAGWVLRLLGWGPRTEQVLAWADGRRDVEVEVAADRAAVHEALRRAAAVVLPSRRVPGWREQVGLSIVEGLAHGCHVLTTDETGLAEGLRAAGHTVVAAGDGPALAAGLGRQVGLPPDKALPSTAEDSRRAALAWLAGDR